VFVGERLSRFDGFVGFTERGGQGLRNHDLSLNHQGAEVLDGATRGHLRHLDGVFEVGYNVVRQICLAPREEKSQK
jgi:hypothetical protein